MNSNPSDSMSYCSWAKKIFKYIESVGESFCGFTLYNREHFVFREPIGDALNINSLMVIDKRTKMHDVIKINRLK